MLAGVSLPLGVGRGVEAEKVQIFITHEPGNLHGARADRIAAGHEPFVFREHGQKFRLHEKQMPERNFFYVLGF